MKRFDETERLFPGMWTEVGKSHRSHPAEIEEDVLVLFHSFLMEVHVFLAQKNFRKWFEDGGNKKFAYIYHRLFFQMMNSSWKPDSHWVLKSPIHSLYMDSLLEQYPDARIIVTHRDPVNVVPSNGKLVENYLHWHYKAHSCDKISFGRYNTDSLLLCAERLQEWQSRTSTKYFNVKYNDLMSNPIEVVHNIYSFFGIPIAASFTSAMEDWLKNNKQGKYGRNTYSLAEYEQTREQVEEEFSNYISCFLGNDKQFK